MLNSHLKETANKCFSAARSSVSVPVPLLGEASALWRDGLRGDAVGCAGMSEGDRAVSGTRLLRRQLHLQGKR